MSHVKLPCIYPISSHPYVNHSGHFSLIREFLQGGARLVQVREKFMTDNHLLKSLRPIVQECHRFGARLVVNDRANVALEAGADGVHLGQNDIDPHEARSLLGTDALIGLSTHNWRQFKHACRESALDYVSLGPVFATTSKQHPDPVLGLESFQKLAGRSQLPVVAIGGIRLIWAREIWSAGATSLAVISDVCASDGPSNQVRKYRKLWKEANEER